MSTNNYKTYLACVSQPDSRALHCAQRTVRCIPHCGYVLVTPYTNFAVVVQLQCHSLRLQCSGGANKNFPITTTSQIWKIYVVFCFFVRIHKYNNKRTFIPYSLVSNQITLCNKIRVHKCKVSFAKTILTPVVKTILKSQELRCLQIKESCYDLISFLKLA